MHRPQKPHRLPKNFWESILAIVVIGGVLTAYLRIIRGTTPGIATGDLAPRLETIAPADTGTVVGDAARAMARGKIRISQDQAMDTAAAPPSPQGNIVLFDITDGLAVAYGDQILGEPSPEDLARIEREKSQGVVTRRAYEANTPQLWDKPIIPYAINPQLPNPDRVKVAIDILNQTTVMKFVPWQGEPDAIVFEKGSENCLSYLGRMGGAQPIRLSAGCDTQEVLHEIMHALGFVHEHSRTDRDSYVEVTWSNIRPEFKAQYTTVPESFMEASRTGDFDYTSIMMYAPDTFAVNPGQLTLRSKSATASISPTPRGLSDGDRTRLRRLYPSAQ